MAPGIQLRKAMLVLGSGATRGGGFVIQHNSKNFQVPLDQGFWSTPIVQTLFDPDRYPALNHYRKIFKTDSLEGVWSQIDLIQKFCLKGCSILDESRISEMLDAAFEQRSNIDESYRWRVRIEGAPWRVPSVASWEILEFIREIYSRLSSPGYESPLKKLINELLLHDLLSGILSFNYDASVETVCRNNFYYSEIEYPSDALKPLFKLHGSLNWGFRNFAPHFSGKIDNPKAADMWHGEQKFHQPEIVGPTFFKQEITHDLQRDPRAIFYRNLWQNAFKELLQINALILIGFSFPQTDFHAKTLFRSAYLNRETKGPFRVIFCHMSDQTVASTLRDIFIGADVEFTEFSSGLEEMARRIDEVIALLAK